MRERFLVYGMTCAACQAAVERTLKKLDGLEEARVNLLKGYADIIYDPDQLSAEQIIDSITSAGYQAELAPEQPDFTTTDAVTEDVQDADVSLEDVLKEAEACTTDACPAPEGEEPGFAKAEPTATEEAAEEKETAEEDVMADLPVTEDEALTVDVTEHQEEKEALKKEHKRRARQKALHDPIQKETREIKHRLIWSFILMLPLIYFMLEMLPGINLPLPVWMQGTPGAPNRAFAQILFTFPILFLNRKFFSSGTKALLKRHPNMDSLVMLGAGSAFLYGVYTLFRMNWGLATDNLELVQAYEHQLYLDGAAMIVTLISLGKYFEMKAKGKTTAAVEELLDLAPETCTIVDGETTREVLAEDVASGTLVVLRPGERVALDGLIVEGRTSVDEAALSGESMPVDKEPGSEVFAGTVNQNGHVIYRVTKRAKDTILAQIAQMVEDAAASKADIARLADKVAAIFVPTVLGIALVTLAVWMLTGHTFEFAMNMAISVLLISCPCALGLATPVAMMVASGRAAQEGILIKGADALERAAGVTDLIMDKTGTVTEGKPEIVAIKPHPASGLSERDLLELTASIEAGSEHPLASAVLRAAADVGIEPWPSEATRALPGRGIFARVYGHNYFAGNLKLLAEAGLSSEEVSLLTEKEAELGRSALLVFDEERYLGLLAAEDRIKDESRPTLHALKQAGLNLLLLSGDHKAAAKSIGRRLGLTEDEIIAEVMPQEKAQVINKIKGEGKVTAMLGDGINDAPALVAADLGIAVGAGTDIAMESADIVLMHSDVRDVISLFELSKKTLRNMKQNLFWAFFYNVLCIPLAAGVFYYPFGLKLNPIYAAAAMSLSSIFVVSNALRLRRFKPSWKVKPLALSSDPAAEIEDPALQRLAKNNRKKHKSQFLEAKGPETQILEGVVEKSEKEIPLTPEEEAALKEAEAEEAALREALAAEEAEPETEESEATETVEAVETEEHATDEPDDEAPETDDTVSEDAAYFDKVLAAMEEEDDADSDLEVETVTVVETTVIETEVPAPQEAEEKAVEPQKTKATAHDSFWSKLYSKQQQEGGLERNNKMTKLKIEGMMCQNCVRHVKEALEAIPGVTDVTVDLDNGEATFAGDVAPETIQKAIADAGYTVTKILAPKA